MFVLKVPEFTHTNERLILTIFGLQLSGPSFDQFRRSAPGRTEEGQRKRNEREIQASAVHISFRFDA